MMILSALAVACSVVMLLQFKRRLFPVIGLIASGLALLMALGMFHLSVGISMGLLLGAAMLVAAVAVHMKTSSKTLVTATSILGLVGAIDVLLGLHMHVL